MKNLSVRAKIIILLSLIVTVVILITSSYSIAKKVEELNKVIIDKSSLLTDLQAKGLSRSLWDFDKEAVDSSLKALIRDKDFYKAEIFDEKGSLFSKVENPKTIQKNIVTQTRKILFASEDESPKKIGTIKTYFTQYFSSQKVWEEIYRLIITNLILLSVLIFGLWIATSLFTKPLINLAQVMSSRLKGDYSVQVKKSYIERTDEIGQVSKILQKEMRQAEYERKMFKLSSLLASGLQIQNLLIEVINSISDIVEAEKSKLFLYDKKTKKLVSKIVDDGKNHPETPADNKVLNDIFKTKKPYINNAKNTNTKNTLAIPLLLSDNSAIGVIQCINKKSGDFDTEDQKRILSMSFQIAMAIDNARLFEETMNLKNYQESILQSLSNGVITIDNKDNVVTYNKSSMRILKKEHENLQSKSLKDLLPKDYSWLKSSLDRANTTSELDVTMDTTITVENEKISVNATTGLLKNIAKEDIGSMIVFEDITAEKRLLGTMSRYMSREVVDRVLQEDPALFEGKQQMATVLFSDIRKFTVIAEKIGAQKTVSFLNSYFERMVSCVLDSGGVLDKYIGDSIMALYGVPFTKKNDADSAVKTGINMMLELNKFNDVQKEKGLQTIDIGIGINSGQVIAGNIGSSKRVEYTVVGDTVNLASRLESLTKYYATPFLISEETVSQLKGEYFLREIDRIKVKGREKITVIYDVIDYKFKGNAKVLIALIAMHDEALTLYRRREWDKALYIFREISESFGEDSLYKRFILRCEILRRDPPGSEWNGVWIMEDK